MAQLIANKMNQHQKNAVLTVLELEMLEFLWRWKIASSSILALKFYSGRSPKTIHSRLRHLERNRFIHFIQDISGHYRGWSLGKKGYHVVRYRLHGIASEGFKTENIHHDLIVTAAHQGPWTISAPKNVILATEQELRRYSKERLPKWVPDPVNHRPDGYWAAKIGKSWSLIALEVELSRKVRGSYETIEQFYRDYSSIRRVLWIVPSLSGIAWLSKVFSAKRSVESIHNFVLLDSFLNYGWNSPIEFGPDRGMSYQAMLCHILLPNGWENAPNSLRNFGPDLQLDSRKCSYMLKSWKNSLKENLGVSTALGEGVKQDQNRKTDSIRELKSPKEIEIGFGVLRELRTHLSFEDYHQLLEQSQGENGYKIVGLYDDDKLVGVMGYRILIDFAHGKQVYVDDLVTVGEARSKGYGAKLLKYAESVAADNGCACLRLCTALENEGAMKFYEREGWQRRSVAYKKRSSQIV